MATTKEKEVEKKPKQLNPDGIVRAWHKGRKFMQGCHYLFIGGLVTTGYDNYFAFAAGAAAIAGGLYVLIWGFFSRD